jgi:hypothetical protein
MRRAACCLAAILLWLVAAPAAAQTTAAVKTNPPQATTQRARGGFTVLVNLGAGFQHDEFLNDTASGVGGINFGIGGFVNEKIAILGRFSGTDVDFGYASQTSGMAGGSIQYWVTDRFTIEAGLGSGFWSDSVEIERGLAIIAAAGVIVFHKGHHNLSAGGEYTPVFAPSGTVHNFAITFGYQYHR